MVNRLKDSSSPYLLQHADNPVDWHPWDEEALALAKQLNKPILVSVGYSTCYWCHVMEREVFDNPEIAKWMNEWFINIKIDREERPDLDEIFMTARQLMSREGGWPNNILLTPDLKPFFAGGTFSADDKYGRPGFPKVLQWLHEAWENQREEVLHTAEETARVITTVLGSSARTQPKAIDLTVVDGLVQFAQNYADRQVGGFYQSPKFPHENLLLFLLDYSIAAKDTDALDIAARALDAMAAGGICDHLGGGFHRYAVDREWKVPHFEKMLYNQALLARCYIHMHQVRGDAYHRYVAERIFDSLFDAFLSPQGAFHAAVDAETDSVEGAYYVWNEKEIRSLLSPREYELFSLCYALAEMPNFPGHLHPDGQVIHARKPLPEIAQEQGVAFRSLIDDLRPIHEKLLTARIERKPPHTDTKIIASWNGMMIDALARAGMVFDYPPYIDAAAKAARFILDNMRLGDGMLCRTWSGGKAQYHGFLEDYASFAAGLLSLQRATKEDEYLKAAQEIMQRADALFQDSEHGAYYFTDGSEKMFVRIQQATDSALPSSSALLLHNFLDLHQITKQEEWLKKAQSLAALYGQGMARQPAEYVHMIHGVLRLQLLQGESLHNRPKTAPIVLPQTGEGADKISANASWNVDFPFASIKLQLEIAEGWHINAHEVSLDYLIPTSVIAQGEGIEEVVEVSYPKPQRYQPSPNDPEVKIYSGIVIISIVVKLSAAPEEHTLSPCVILRCQPCSQSQCLAPVEITIPVTGD